MKAIIEYNFPDDENDFILAINAGQYHSALYNIQSQLKRVMDQFDEAKTVEECIGIFERYQVFINEEVFECKMLP